MPKDKFTELGWVSEPSSMKTAPDLELWRVPKKGTLTAIIISHDLLGRGIHYYLGRSGPCTGDDCQACLAGRTPREYFWIVAMHQTTDQIFLLELTDRAAAPLARAWHQFRTLRGLIFEVGRTTKKDNGPQRLKLHGKVADEKKLPTAPAIIPILNRIWQTAADPWKHASADQIRKFHEQVKREHQNAINPTMGQQPTPGNKHPGGPRTNDDLPITTGQERSIREVTATGTSDPIPSDPEGQVPHGRNGMAVFTNLVPPIVRTRGESS